MLLLRVLFVMGVTLGLGRFAATAQAPAAPEADWFVFNPAQDDFRASPIDLRFLNEKVAGEHGFITTKAGHFTLGNSGEPVRFWAVNGPPHDQKPEQLRQMARLLAKHGVNMVRSHGGMFTPTGEVDPAKVRQAQEIVAAMKQEGIYTHFSIYFPLWLSPKADDKTLKGYNGSRHPFVALFFDPEFQSLYRKWWEALLLTPDPKTGTRLVDDPAVFGLEMQNEDSFFFWTFGAQNIPDAELRILEKHFGDWLIKRHGSLEAARAKWNNAAETRDNLAEGRMAFRPLWNLFNQKQPRELDTVRFLYETQSEFYRATYAFLRKLGFRGVITASNWTTASAEVLTPLEKLSYTTGDFIDRHGYFSCLHKGDSSDWSIRDKHTYADRSAFRFDPETPGKPKQFVHPAMDPHYNHLPSMISETTFNRPNRYRAEAPLYFSVFGAVQDSDAIVHFALDGSDWNVKPGYFMQPWTLLSPAMGGQFPAAALIYRQGLIAVGETLAEVNLNVEDLLALKGTPLPQDASFDELRLKDVPQGSELKTGQRLDPLLHYAGRTEVNFVTNQTGGVKLKDASRLIDRKNQTVTTSSGDVKLDYANGVLKLNSAKAQGLAGNLKQAGKTVLHDLEIESTLELGAIVIAPLDGKPLATSSKMLLQVMSEEKATGFATEEAGPGLRRISNIGRDPWLVRQLNGTVRFKRPDAASLKVTALDFNGYAKKNLGQGGTITLQPEVVYYLIER